MPFTTEGDSTARAYNVAYTVLIGVIFLTVLPFALLALMRTRSERDPARRFVPWIKIAFLTFVIAVGLLLAQGILNTYEIYSDTSHWHIIRATYHVGYLADLFRTILSATITVFLLELGPSIHTAIQGASDTLDKAIRYVAYIVAAVVISLALAFYGLSVDFQENYTNNIGGITRGRDAVDRIETINQIMASAFILLWIASLVITGLSLYTFLRRKASPVKSASDLYMVASLLNLLASTWNFAYAINWLLGSDVLRENDYYVLILSIILGLWSQGIVLILSYVIAQQRAYRGGVWSPQKYDYRHC